MQCKRCKRKMGFFEPRKWGQCKECRTFLVGDKVIFRDRIKFYKPGEVPVWTVIDGKESFDPDAGAYDLLRIERQTTMGIEYDNVAADHLDKA